MQVSAVQRREAREDLHSGQLLVVDLTSENPALRTHGVVLNISTGGMSVQTLRPLHREEVSEFNVAEFILTFSDASGSTCKGRLAWEKPGGLAGIRFVDSPLKSLPHLREHFPPRFLSTSSALPLSACRSEGAASEFDNTLQLLACSAMSLTAATGAAIAVGDRNGMECRASVGTAPGVGTKLGPESGISGHSLRTGAIVLCGDTATDPRVNPEARQSDIRSVLVVPTLSGKNVVGLTEAFSRDANHFDEHYLELLQPLVSVLADAIKENALKDEIRKTNAETHPGAEAVASPVLAADPVASPAAAEPFAGERLSPTDAFGWLPETASYGWLRRHSRSVIGILLLAVCAVAAWLTYRHDEAGSRNTTSRQSASSSATSRSATAGVFAATAEISFSPPVIDRPVGTTFGVNIMMKGAQNLWSAPMQVSYDPQTLQVIAVTSGGLFERDGQAATFVHRVDAMAGRIDVSISRPLSAPGVSGDGVVFSIVFLGKAKGDSKLRIDQTGLRDTSTKALAASSSDAVVTISSVAPLSQGAGGESDAIGTLPQSSPTTQPAQSSTTDATAGSGQNNAALPPVMATAETAALRNQQPNQQPISQSDSQPTDEGIPLPMQQPVTIADLKIPTINAAIALAPRISVPNFVLERTFQGHTNWVTTVAFSANGQRLLTGSWDKSVKVWDVATGRALSTISSKGGGLQTSALSHDGRLIAAEDANNNIKIWNSATGDEIRTVKGDRSPWDKSWVYSIAFSPDDQLLAAALDNKTVQLWEVTSGSVVQTLMGSSRAFIYVAFSPDGRLLATGGGPKTIDLWDVATGNLVRTLKGHRQDIYAVAFSPDGRRLASGSKDKTLKLWDVASGRELQTLTGHQGFVTSLAFSVNGRWLASGSWDKTVKIWDVETGGEVQTLTGNTHQIYSLAFDSHRGYLATGSEGGTIKLWRLNKEINLAVLDQEDSRSASTSVATTSHAQ